MSPVSMTSAATLPQSSISILPSYDFPLNLRTTSVTHNLQSVIALLGIIYFLLATGPREILRVLPWFVWGQIFLDGLLLVFWLAASATSSYNYSDLYNACGYNNLFYPYLLLYKRDTSPTPKGLARSLEPRRSAYYGGSSIGAKAGLDAIMTCVPKHSNLIRSFIETFASTYLIAYPSKKFCQTLSRSFFALLYPHLSIL